MSDDHAFLAAICEQPDDVALRLVYADWLEERGDERHELIRVEAAMRAVPIWSDEFQRLKPTRARLRAALPAEWLAAMDYLPKHRPMFGTLPPTAAERWRLAEEFIDIWHGGLKPGDGYTEAEVAEAEGRLGCRLPAALRSWYLRAGKRQDIWSNQDGLTAPHLLRFENTNLVFHRENQNCTQWYIRPEEMSLADPPVYGGHSAARVAENVTLFMLLVLVYESQFRSRAWCEVRNCLAANEFVSPRFRATALPTGYWSNTTTVRFWEDTDVILMSGMSGGDDDVFGSCRTEVAFERLLAEFGDRVDRFD